MQVMWLRLSPFRRGGFGKSRLLGVKVEIYGFQRVAERDPIVDRSAGISRKISPAESLFY